jgi:hypothetical protein
MQALGAVPSAKITTASRVPLLETPIHFWPPGGDRIFFLLNIAIYKYIAKHSKKHDFFEKK